MRRGCALRLAAASGVTLLALGFPAVAQADAICGDGTYSESSGSGTCSWHDGVARWVPEDYNGTTTYQPPTSNYRYQPPTNNYQNEAVPVAPRQPAYAPSEPQGRPWYLTEPWHTMWFLAAVVIVCMVGALIWDFLFG